jgi:hypothetical protein
MPYIGNPIYQSAFVVDQFSGDGTTTAFTMSVAPAGVTNVLVAVSGVLQDPSTYGVVGNTITFSAAPPSGTGNISCRYLGVPASGVTTTAYRTVTEFTATASQTTFTPPSYNVGFINVYLNGVLLGSADYTATNGTTVVLATGASAGNLLTVESFLISSVANAIPNAAGSVGTTNIADNAITTAKIALGAVIPADLSTGGPYWDTSSRLGVGTTSPQNTLEVYNGSDTQVRVRNGALNTQSYDFGRSGSTGLLNFYGNQTGFTGYVFGGVDGTRMTIDSSGRVTTPFQPMFYARKDNSQTISSGTLITFTNVTTNIGSHYNSSTSRFTAPVSGVYSFSARVIINRTGLNYANINPCVNGAAIPASGAYFDTAINNTGFANYGQTLQYYLNAGDYVDWIVGCPSGTVGVDNSGYFCGFLVG